MKTELQEIYDEVDAQMKAKTAEQAKQEQGDPEYPNYLGAEPRDPKLAGKFGPKASNYAEPIKPEDVSNPRFDHAPDAKSDSQSNGAQNGQKEEPIKIEKQAVSSTPLPENGLSVPSYKELEDEPKNFLVSDEKFGTLQTRKGSVLKHELVVGDEPAVDKSDGQTSFGILKKEREE